MGIADGISIQVREAVLLPIVVRLLESLHVRAPAVSLEKDLLPKQFNK